MSRPDPVSPPTSRLRKASIITYAEQRADPPASTLAPPPVSRFSWTTASTKSLAKRSSIYSQSEGSPNADSLQLDSDNKQDTAGEVPAVTIIIDWDDPSMTTPRPRAKGKEKEKAPQKEHFPKPEKSEFKPSTAPFPTVIVTPIVKAELGKPKVVRTSVDIHWDMPIVPAKELDNYTWKPLPLAHALGIPLLYLNHPFRPNKRHDFNYFLQVLNIKSDFTEQLVKWTNECIPPPYPEMVEGPAMLIRSDGRAVRTEHIEFLATYIDQCLSEVRDFYESAPATQHQMHDMIQAVRANGTLSPEKFAIYWYKLMNNRRAAGDRTWDGIECPVVNL